MNSDDLKLQRNSCSFLNVELSEFNEVFEKLIYSPLNSPECPSLPPIIMQNNAEARINRNSSGQDRERLRGDPAMGSMPSLGRYSSLPNRHLLKRKDYSDVGKKLESVDLKTSTSSDAVNANRNSFVVNRSAFVEGSEYEQDNLGVYSVTPLSLTDVHQTTDAAPNVEPVKECCVGDSVGDSETPLSRRAAAEHKNAAFSSGRCSSLSSGLASNNFAGVVVSAADAVTPRVTVDGDGDEPGGVINRMAMDDAVMSMVPSFGKYGSLPPKRSFERKCFPSPGRMSHVPDNDSCAKVRKSELVSGGVSYQRPLSDDIGTWRLNERQDSSPQPFKSFSSSDVSRRADARSAWVPFKTFEDTILEYAPDSAYQTSDTLKLHTFSLSKEELQSRIENFNLSQENFKIEMEPESDIYHGCIRILIDIVRPVDVRTSIRPPSSVNVCQTSETNDDEKVDSFHLPRSYLATVRISSETTADQVINEILNKYNIKSHSGRFALFEKINRKPDEGHLEEIAATVYLRKLSNKERPLELCLHSIDESKNPFEERHFLLRENDKGEILWEAFSLPELSMFLDILLREEESYIESIRHKYATLRNVLEQKLDLERKQNYEFLTHIRSPRSSSSAEDHA